MDGGNLVAIVIMLVIRGDDSDVCDDGNQLNDDGGDGGSDDNGNGCYDGIINLGMIAIVMMMMVVIMVSMVDDDDRYLMYN